MDYITINLQKRDDKGVRNCQLDFKAGTRFPLNRGINLRFEPLNLIDKLIRQHAMEAVGDNEIDATFVVNPENLKMYVSITSILQCL